MKFILTVVLVFVSCARILCAQSISITNVDTSAFPIVKAKFFAFDANGVQQRPGTSEVVVKENGSIRTVLRVSCPPDAPKQNISSVLVIDVSGSMGSDQRSPTNMELAKAAGRAWIDGLPQGLSECAVASFDDQNYLDQDFTRDRSLLQSAITRLQPNGGTDYNAALITKMAGGLCVSNSGQYKRVIVFLTDGMPQQLPDVASIVREAQRQQCMVYCVTLGMPAPSSVRAIATGTGGRFYENVTTLNEAVQAYQEILALSQSSTPCEVEWMGAGLCTGTLTDVELQWQGKSALAKYLSPVNAAPRLVLQPAAVVFQKPAVAVGVDSLLTISASNQDVVISSVQRTAGSLEFTVDTSMFPLKIPRGESRSVPIRCVSSDSSDKYAVFEVNSDACPVSFSCRAGYGGKRPKVRTLRLTFPNGGESLIAGTDTTVTWEGVSRSDTVCLEYSKDLGRTWDTITTRATGLQYVWRHIPLPASDSCIVRVTQFSGGSRDAGNFTVSNGIFEPNPSYSKYIGTSSLEWSADGKRLLVGTTQVGWLGGVRKTSALASIHDVASRTVEWSRTLTTPTGAYDIGTVQWDPTGTLISFGGSYDNVKLGWNRIQRASSGSYVFQQIPIPNTLGSGGFRYSVWFPSGDRVLLNSGHVYDLKKDTLGQFAVTNGGQQPCISSTSVIIPSWGTLRRHDALTGELLDTLDLSSIGTDPVIYDVRCPLSGEVFAVHFRVLESGLNVSYLGLFETSTMKLLSQRKIELLENSGQYAIDISPDGRTISYFEKGRVATWDAYLDETYVFPGLAEWYDHIRWSPGGDRLATSGRDLKVWTVNSIVQTDTSDARFSIVAPNPIGRDVDMGLCVVGSGKDSVVRAFIRNAGSYQVRVDSITIVGAEKSHFALISGHTSPWIPPGGEHAVELRFAPTTWGSKFATLRVSLSTETKNFTLRGMGIDPSLRVVGKLIDFDTVDIGQRRDSLRVAAISNVGTAPVRCTAMRHAGPNSADFSTITSTAPFTLAPGDTAFVALRFAPTQAGRTSGRLIFEHDGAGGAAVVQLFGTGRTKGAQISTEDQTKVLTCEKSIRDSFLVSNSGSDTLRINNASLRGADASEFSIETAFPLSVAPAGTAFIQYSCAPASFGMRAATVELRCNVADDSVHGVSLNVTKEVVGFRFEVDTINIGVRCPNDVVDTVVTLSNIGSRRNGLKLQSPIAVVATGPSGLEAGDSADATLRITMPSLEGNYSEVVTMVDSLCNQQVSLVIRGTVRATRVLVDTLYDYGELATGTTKEEIVRVVNQDSRPISVRSISGLTGPFSIVTTTPALGTSIPSGDSLMITIACASPLGLQRSPMIIEFVQPCTESVASVLQVLGRDPDTVRMTVAASNLTAGVGEQIRVDLELSQVSGMDAPGAPTMWTSTLVVNRTVLSPLDASTQISGPIDSTEIRLTGVYDLSSSKLYSMPCVATLGTSDNTPVIVKEFKWTDGSLATVVDVNDGSVRVVGVCEEGGVRLYVPTSTSSSLAIRPNPVVDNLHIEYGLVSSSSVQLDLINSMGQVVQSVVSSALEPAGLHMVDVDVSSFNAGVYVARLQTHGRRLISRFDISK